MNGKTDYHGAGRRDLSLSSIDGVQSEESEKKGCEIYVCDV